MATVLLLHGWNWKKYPAFHPKHQWEDRQEFLDILGDSVTVDYPSMPGFAAGEGGRTGSWNLDDFADWLDARIAGGAYDAIAGYSFGCAVATQWQVRAQRRDMPLVLISPAISRVYNEPNGALIGVANTLKRLHLHSAVEKLRGTYLKRVIKNPYVVHGSPFLGATYQSIVRADLAADLRTLIAAGFPVHCVFGADDTATPPELLFQKVPEARELATVIAGAGHDIGGTHPQEVAAAMLAFMKESPG